MVMSFKFRTTFTKLVAGISCVATLWTGSAPCAHAASSQNTDVWHVDNQADWESHQSTVKNAEFKEGFLYPNQEEAAFQSTIKRFDEKRQASSLAVKQSDLWQNWNPCPNIGPKLGDSPVLLSLGPENYWIFGRCHVNTRELETKTVHLPGYDEPLLATPNPNEFVAPGGLEPHAGG